MMNHKQRNPFNLPVVDRKEECWCGITIAGDWTVAHSCQRHGVPQLRINGNDERPLEQIEGYDPKHATILATLTSQDYD